MSNVRVLSYILIAVLLIGCASRSPLVAKWKKDNGSTIEFFKDGTFSVYEKDPFMSTSTAGKWHAVDANAILLEANAGIFGNRKAVMHWTIDSEMLRLKEDSGHITTYYRERN